MSHEPGERGRHHGHGSGHGGRSSTRDGFGHHGRRLFAPGDFRLLMLSLLQERAAHGYELMRLVADMFGGTYTPSPGMIYPTLTWLEEQGLITRRSASAGAAVALEGESEGRKPYQISAAGRDLLEAQRAGLDGLLSRLRLDAQSLHARRLPDSIHEALHTLRHALHVSNLDWSAARSARVRAAIEAVIAEVSAR